ncbi:MAG: GntR family transcriptional regulator [Deltaproteobacteria bacterium]|nr:GntR family transcriptional regulator [Deltaproteobacteria bacterium]
MEFIKSMNDHQSLSDRVSRLIENSILDGSISPGERIIESDIAKRLGISKAPVREALKRLEGDSIVQHLPRRGYFTNTIDMKSISDFFEIAFIIEPIVARNALKKKTDTVDETLVNLLKDMKKALRDKDFETYLAHNTRFHSLFRDLNDNEWIIKVSHMLSKQTRILTALSLSVPARYAESIQEHAEIADAFHKGSPKALDQAIIKHLKKFKENIIKSYETLEMKETL